MPLETIGDKVREQRVLRGWDQAELAQRMRMSVPTISRIENGGRELSVKELHSLAAIFNLSLSDFVEGPTPLHVSTEESDLLVGLMRVSRRYPHPVLRRVIALAEELAPYLQPPDAPSDARSEAS